MQVSTNSPAAEPVNVQKIDGHAQNCSSPPAARNPTAAPDPATPAQIPIALVRSAFG